MPTDLEFAQALLDGIVETDKRGRLRLRYLKEGSSGELNARVALSKLLRSDEGLNRRLRDFLAELFDANPPARQQRKLIFAFRRPGKKTDPYANAHVFVEVATAVKSGSTAAAAIADTAQQHGISEELVKRIWLKNRKDYMFYPSPRRARRLPLKKRSKNRDRLGVLLVSSW
jgi:hypothetical protein